MTSRALLVLVLSLLSSSAAAQMGPPPEPDRCGAQARRVGVRAGRARAWPTREPAAGPIGTLGRGVIWRAVDNPRCCDLGRGCSSTSEREDALLGTVDGRIFVLTSAPPSTTPFSVSGENRLAEPFVARGWGAFLRAAGALPTSGAGALEIAWLVYASAFPGLGRVEDVATFDADLAPRALELGPSLQPGAVVVAGGFEVTLWAGRRSLEGHLRDSGMGASSDQRLRRAVVRFDRRGTVTIVEDVPVVGNVSRVRAPAVVEVHVP